MAIAVKGGLLVGAKITGFDDFKKAQEKLGGRKLRTLLQRALNQAVQPVVVKEARSNVDKNVGRLSGEGRKNIKKRNLNKKERDELGVDQAVMVYLDEDGFYLRFWELGFTRDGKQYPAKPWMRPAFDSQQQTVLNTYKARAGALVEKELAKK
jgi:HK97 gp10 family phage protein